MSFMVQGKLKSVTNLSGCWCNISPGLQRCYERPAAIWDSPSPRKALDKGINLAAGPQPAASRGATGVRQRRTAVQWEPEHALAI